MSRGIKSASTAWMAAQHPFDRFPTAAKSAVFGHGIDGVLAACRVEAALAAEEGAEGDAVEQDELDQQPAHLIPV